MKDPITRVLTALEILQSTDSVTGAELAERLEVDLRTVQRYMLKLRDLNVPVEASPGVGGAYRLRPGFRLPPLLLTNEEAFAIALGLKALRHVALAAFAPATDGAVSKLARVLPDTLRESLRMVEESISLEPNRWVMATSTVGLVDVCAAIRKGRKLRFAYSSHTQEASTRDVEPYALLHKNDHWYLVGHCCARNAMRTFRLDRMTDIAMTRSTFKRPVGFDASAYVDEQLPFIESRYKVDVWIDLPVDEAQRSFALWRVALEQEGEGTRMRCTRDGLDKLAASLLSLRRRMVIHGPPQLRKAFRLLAEEALEAAGAS